MTAVTWPDIGTVVIGVAMGVVASWILRPANLGKKALILLIFTLLSVLIALTVIKDNPDDSRYQITAVSCPRVFDKAHADLKSPLAAPPLAGFAFTPSQDLPGRDDLTLTWINPQPITESAVAIAGVYGQADTNDGFIDHSEPAAATGECWNWYHYGPRDDAQPETVRLRINGLWPGQQYCFYTMYRISTGYSKPTEIRCETAMWKPEWGTPAQAPQQ
jgi:hypothetical protein